MLAHPTQRFTFAEASKPSQNTKVKNIACKNNSRNNQPLEVKKNSTENVENMEVNATSKRRRSQDSLEELTCDLVKEPKIVPEKELSSPSVSQEGILDEILIKFDEEPPDSSSSQAEGFLVEPLATPGSVLKTPGASLLSGEPPPGSPRRGKNTANEDSVVKTGLIPNSSKILKRENNTQVSVRPEKEETSQSGRQINPRGRGRVRVRGSGIRRTPQGLPKYH